MQALELGLLVVGGSVVLALAGLLAVRRFVPFETLREHNEVAGFLIPIVGIAYAVLLAFMVIAVWQRYEAAQENINKEADEALVIFRLAPGLGDADRARVQDVTRSYVDAVISDDWPAMRKGKQSAKVSALTGQLWNTFDRLDPQTSKQSDVYAESLTHLTALTAGRRDRVDTLHGAVPQVIWFVLGTGGVLTVAFTYFFGVRSLRSQLLMTALVTAAIAVSFYLVVVLNTPFKGSVRLKPQPFVATAAAIRSEAAPAVSSPAAPSGNVPSARPAATPGR